MNNNALIKAEKVFKHFPVKAKLPLGKNLSVKAVDGISLNIQKGETLGIVGESGSGKSTLGRVLLGLLQPTAGNISYNGRDIRQLGSREAYLLRRKMQIIFQDPFGSLNPRINIGRAIGEPLEVHGLAKGKANREKVMELLESVGLSKEHFYSYPHEFSGGQRQRIVIARALALQPEFVVCDEPVSALDVSIQSQILNLLIKLQSQYSLTYLFISHDLRVVQYMADRVAVMYLGVLVEEGKTEQIYKNALHPYTQGLIAAIPKLDNIGKTKKRFLKGDIPSPINPPAGCRVHTRCPVASDTCKEVEPPLKEVEKGHYVACHLIS